MNNPPRKTRPSFLEALFRLVFRSKTSFPKKPAVPADAAEPARRLPSRVLLAIYDPVMDPASGVKLTQLMHWQSPDELVNDFIKDILETSGGLAHYQVVERLEFNEFPVKTDGFCYDPRSYLDVLKGDRPAHIPDGADYQALLSGLNGLPRIASQEIDEVWLVAFPYAGFYESSMGGEGAFWCNSPPMAWSSGCARRFIVMGFSCERGVGEMLESFGHRSESLLSKVFNCQDFIARAYQQVGAPRRVGSNLNPFQHFICFDKIAPGRAGIGTIHYAPNSDRDYDWNNPRLVPSDCDEWFNYPDLKKKSRPVNADEWGRGDIRAHHKWWLMHLPKAAGRTDGVANNWWQYIMDPNLVNP